MLGNPHSDNPTSAAATELVEQARAAVLAVLQRLAGGVQRGLHGQRHRRAQARRRGLSASRRRPPPAHVRQPQLGERHARVRARRRRDDDVRARDAALAARRRAAARARGWAAREPPPPEPASPTRRSRTSRASSTRSTGFARRRRPAGTCSSTPPRSCRPTASTSASGSRTSSRSRSTSCSATRPASAACSPARRRWPAAPALVRRRHDRRGQRAGRRALRRPKARRGFEDGTINYLALPAVELGLALVDGIGIDTIHARVRCLTGLAAGRAGRAAARERASRWSQLYGPRTTDRRGGTVAFNLRAAGRAAGRHPDRRGRAAAARHLAAHGLLLQPRVPRSSRSASSRRRSPAGRVRQASGDFCAGARRRERRRGSRLARAGDDVRRRLPLHALRRRVLGLSGVLAQPIVPAPSTSSNRLTSKFAIDSLLGAGCIGREGAEPLGRVALVDRASSSAQSVSRSALPLSRSTSPIAPQKPVLSRAQGIRSFWTIPNPALVLLRSRLERVQACKHSPTSVRRRSVSLPGGDGNATGPRMAGETGSAIVSKDGSGSFPEPEKRRCHVHFRSRGRLN